MKKEKDYKNYNVRVFEDGTKEWFLNELCHREDGPAVERIDGSKEWWLFGEIHSEIGFAEDGTKIWILNGDYVTEKEFNKKIKKLYI